MSIDSHTHFFPKAFLEEIGRRGQPFGMELTPGPDGVPTLLMHGVPHPDLRPFLDVEHHLRRMNASQIDMHVVWQSSRPNVFWADADLGLALCQIINDEYADLVARHPGRFAAIASVPLQDIGRSVAEAWMANGRARSRRCDWLAVGCQRRLCRNVFQCLQPPWV